jgi:hypothetical protein
MITYLSHVRAYLTGSREEHDASHPLLRAQPRLSSKVVKVVNKSFEDVSEPGIWICGIDQIDVLRDVVDGEVHQGWDLDLRWVHVRQAVSVSMGHVKGILVNLDE